ncbi:DLW-39 family protein [Boudabousia tangfeifanii]|nr:DLW-39 family protein [Boudabousia tangfeifanii]
MKRFLKNSLLVGTLAAVALAGYSVWRDLGIRKEIWHEVTDEVNF